MKRIYNILLLLMILSCNSNNETIPDEKIIIDSLQSQLNLKDKELVSLEFDKLNNDSVVNQYALYIQKIKNNINEINYQERIINNATGNEEFYIADTTNIIDAIKIMSEKLLENESIISELNNAVSQEKNKNSQSDKVKAWFSPCFFYFLKYLQFDRLRYLNNLHYFSSKLSRQQVRRFLQ